MQIYTGLDLSRNRLDWHACSADGTLVGAGAVPPDPDGLTQLVRRLGDANVLAVIEVMNDARFVHDQLELRAWDVRLADPQRSRALAPLACKTDRIDAWVLAELARRDLIRRSDRRGALTKHGPDYLRWALIEAAHTAARYSPHRELTTRYRARHGGRRGSAVAAVTIARKLTEAIWWMLTRNQPYAPAGAQSA
jgi:transposase